MKKAIIAMLATMGASGIVYAQQGEVRTVNSVNLNSYAGQWYEIARLPNRFQSKCVGNVTAEYVLRQDGKVQVVNRCKKADGSYEEIQGVAEVLEDSGSAKLKVSFAPEWLSWVPFVWGDYWIIGLANDYSYAVVGEPDQKYLWILGRKPELPAASWAEAMEIAASNGFDADKLVKTPQER